MWDALVHSINERLRKIQLVANAAWPPNAVANVELRTRFLLPPDREVSRGEAGRTEFRAAGYSPRITVAIVTAVCAASRPRL